VSLTTASRPASIASCSLTTHVKTGLQPYSDDATSTENAIALRLLAPSSFPTSTLQAALGRSSTHLVAVLKPGEESTLPRRSRVRVVSAASAGRPETTECEKVSARMAV
jgi:hypothetical protein